ncbi:hypothetical protein BOO31_18895 [Vibrio navarrensis]|nr:hypothetical protein [Vibrio navarrensis]
MKDLVRKLVLLIGLVLSFASQANDLVPLKMLNGKVTISTPRDFVPMSKEIIEKWPPIFGHDFKWSICFDSTQQYRDRL